jgi:5-oxoprolinase (ATP-hydrolysing) subunit A
MKSIDINCDMGELIDGHFNYDSEIMPFISSCNISCGFHSGHPLLIEKTILSALHHNVAIGAHPSYDDKENFGRQSLSIPLPQLQSQIRYQVSAMKGMVESHGGHLHHVKAHGALYNDMHQDEQLARTVIEAITAVQADLIIYLMSGSPLINICNEMNVAYMEEVFADRSYIDVHNLQSRNIEGAVISDTNLIINRIDDITTYKIKDISGNKINIHSDTVCVHSDTPYAIEIAKTIFQHLSNKNIEISANRG